MASFSIIQSDSADPNPSDTLASDWTAGSLGIVALNERSGSGEANHDVTNADSDVFNKSIGHDQELGDLDARHSSSLWWRSMDGTEPRLVTGSVGAGVDGRISILEIAADEAVTWAEEGVASDDTGSGSSSPLASGDTVSVPAEDLLAVAVVTWRNGTGDPGSIAITIDGAAADDTLTFLDGTNGRSHAIGIRKLTTGGAKSASVSWTGTGHEATIQLGVFGTGVGGGGGTSISQASEADSAQSLSASKQQQIAQVSETDSAQSLASIKAHAIGQATETGAAQALSASKTQAIGQVVETDAAQQLASSKVQQIGQVTEADSARSLAAQKTQAIGQVSETDAARPMSVSGATVIGQVSETDASQPFSASKAAVIGRVTETDSVFSLATSKFRGVGQVVEVSTARSLSAGKLRVIGQAVEVSSARPMTSSFVLAASPILIHLGLLLLDDDTLLLMDDAGEVVQVGQICIHDVAASFPVAFGVTAAFPSVASVASHQPKAADIQRQEC